MALDPGTPTTMLVGMRDLCEATNIDSTPVGSWADISSGVTDSPIGALAISDAGGTKIYMSDNNGRSWFTTNNGTSWASMDLGTPGGGPLNAVSTATGGGPAPSYGFGVQVSGMAADPTTSGIVYATVNGFQGGSANHVFKWTAGGANGTWTDISGNLPDEPYDCVAVNPAFPSEIFVGGITGVFVTFDGGTTWSQLGPGLPNVQVDGLTASKDGTTLVAFTHGRSAWQITGTPTAVHVSSLRTHVAHGWTTMTWRSLQKVAGYNIYRGKSRLNRKLVTSRTHIYSFRVHKVVRNPKLVAVPLA